MTTTMKIITRRPVVLIHCTEHGCPCRIGGATLWQAYHRLSDHLTTEHISPLWTRGRGVALED